jgi:hypothetical protein
VKGLENAQIEDEKRCKEAFPFDGNGENHHGEREEASRDAEKIPGYETDSSGNKHHAVL